uniref:Dual specificity protein phosphatase n=1 Tax=Zosterops lateralis melanops TaxID=1220523 RepID=A0A8D2P7Q7_ZOSLA
ACPAQPFWVCWDTFLALSCPWDTFPALSCPWDTFPALRCPLGHFPCPEVSPGTLSLDIASNRRELLQLRITHVLNASHCRWRGGAEFYEGTGIRYLGIEAHDSPSFDMSPYFYPAADFIHQALNEGRILVHCAVGVSRSATLVLAYLMIRHHMPLVEAIKTVKDHRGIIPNRGFLRQLVALDNALRLKRSS